MSLAGPFASAAAACKSAGVGATPLFAAVMAAVHPADPIYDTVTIPRGVDYAVAANVAALEVANGYTAGTCSYDAVEQILSIPMFLFGRYNSGSTVPNRYLDSTNIYGGTFGSIHHQDGQHGVAQPSDRGPWRSAFLAAAMAIDTYGDDEFSITASDLTTLQQTQIEQEYISAGRPLGDSPTHVGQLSNYPGCFQSHTGDGDGGNAVSQYGKGSNTTGIGLAPRKLPRPAVVALHDDSVKSSPTRAYLSLRIPFGTKVVNGSVLSVARGFDLLDNGAGAFAPAVANAVQNGVRVRVTLFPKLDADPKGAFGDFALQSYLMRSH